MKTAAQNATKHGLLSELPVIDGIETREAWLSHRQSFWDDLKPQGAVEETLVERIALTFWRLARLARAETAAANRRREEQIECAARVWHPDLQTHITLAEAHAELQHRDDVCDWLAAYASHADLSPVSESLSEALGRHLLSFLAEFEATREDADEDLPPSHSAALPSGSRRPTTTAGGMHDCFDHVALLTGTPVPEVLRYVTAEAQASAATFARSVRDVERKVEQTRATTQLPTDHDLQLFTRYDAHLGRELARLFRTLKDLRTLGPRVALEDLPTAALSDCLNAGTPEDLEIGPLPAPPARKGVKRPDPHPSRGSHPRRPRRGR